MNRIVLIAVLTVLMVISVLLSGCSHYYGPKNTAGEHILISSGVDSLRVPMVKQVFNDSPYVLMIDLDGDRSFDWNKLYLQASPGDTLSFELDRRYENLDVTIFFWPYGYQDKLGTTQEKLCVQLPGLFDDGLFTITEATLWDRAPMIGFFTNRTPYRITQLWDDRGNHYGSLDVGETSRLFQIVSGPIIFFWTTDNPYNVYPTVFSSSYKSYRFWIDKKRKQCPYRDPQNPDAPEILVDWCYAPRYY